MQSNCIWGADTNLEKHIHPNKSVTLKSDYDEVLLRMVLDFQMCYPAYLDKCYPADVK